MDIAFSNLRESLVETARDFYRERSWRMAAAITFYLLFTLGPMLALELRLADVVVSGDAFRDKIVEIFTRAVGEEGGEAIENLLSEFQLPRSGIFEIVLGVLMMIFGGANALGQTRNSMASLWGVEESERERSGIRQVLIDVGFTFAAAMVLIASVIIHSLWFFARDAMEGGNWASISVAGVLYVGLSLGLLASVFYAIFRMLPPRRLAERALWVGALTTALLFSIGRQLMVVWIASSEITSTYGSISFMIILLVWMYFFSQILLFGASFTYQYHQRIT